MTRVIMVYTEKARLASISVRAFLLAAVAANNKEEERSKSSGK